MKLFLRFLREKYSIYLKKVLSRKKINNFSVKHQRHTSIDHYRIEI